MTGAAATPPVDGAQGFEDHVLERLRGLETFALRAGMNMEALATDPNVKGAVAELQTIVGDLIAAIDTHFGPGKIALPGAPTQAVK